MNETGPAAASSVIPVLTEQVDRRMSLLQAAFDVIAAAGFEGLRTRAVAERAGVSVATLHYHFPTKQALIEGLAEFLGRHYFSLHAPPPEPTGYPALDQFRQEFADAQYYAEEQKELMIVLQELILRGQRDPQVRTVTDRMVWYWRTGLEKMAAQGLAEGTFRADLDPHDITATLIGVFTGMSFLGKEGIERVRKSVEQWILTDVVKGAMR